jgi:hypothetical protein
MKLSPEIQVMLAIITPSAVLFPLIVAGLLMLFRNDPLFGPNYSGPIHLPVGNIYNFFILLLFLGLAVQFLLALPYLVYASENMEATDSVLKILKVGFFLLPVLAMPIYYIFYIWPKRRPNWAVKSPTGAAGR